MINSVGEENVAQSICVMSGGAPKPVLEALKQYFESIYSCAVQYEFEHVSVIEKWLANRKSADVILLPEAIMNRVSDFVEWQPNSRRVLARVGIGVIVNERSPAPDISTRINVRNALVAARSIAVPKRNGLTGSHLMKVLSQLEITELVGSRLIHKAAIYGAGDLVARGEADIGIYLASEVNSIPGTSFVGLLPDELQNFVVYEVGVPRDTRVSPLATAYVDFISGLMSESHWRAAGFQYCSLK